MIAHANQPRTGALAAVLGAITLLAGATGVVGQLEDALNTIWEVAPKPGRGVTGFLKDNVLSLAMVLGFGFLLLVSLILSTALTAMANFFVGLIPALAPAMEAADFVISLAVTVLLFAMIFKLLPEAKVAGGDVWIGAALTALLFTMGKFLLGLYLGRSGITSTYGAAGSLVALLVWVHYSAQIVFFDAEFTKVYANRFGSRIVPAEDAVPLTPEARAEQGMPRRKDLEAKAEPVHRS
jgi:membrane protein